MATLRLLLVATLLALPLSVAHSTSTYACIYGPTPTFDEVVADTDLIVIGTVSQLIVLPPEAAGAPEVIADNRVPVEATFVVSEYLKGSGRTTLLTFQVADTVLSDANRVDHVESPHTDCGFSATNLNESYVVFLNKHDELRYTWSGRLFTDKQEVASYVANIRAAVARNAGLPLTGSGPPRHSAPIAPLIAASALAGVALAANAAFVLRRRSR